MGFKIAVNAGDPVAKSDKVFGDTIQLARYLCTVMHNNNHIVELTQIDSFTYLFVHSNVKLLEITKCTK